MAEKTRTQTIRDDILKVEEIRDKYLSTGELKLVANAEDHITQLLLDLESERQRLFAAQLATALTGN